MNKTTEALKLAEEALIYHTQQTRPIQKTDEAIFAIREALAEPDWYEEAMRLGGLNAKHVGELKQLRAEPVKHEVNQEPVGEMIDKNGYKGAAWYCEPPITGTQLYAAPIDAKAIREAARAEALEEAAKVCDDESRYSNYADCCAAAIRRLK